MYQASYSGPTVSILWGLPALYDVFFFSFLTATSCDNYYGVANFI